jgi:hypothetical protein
MQPIKIESDQITLPQEVAKKLFGKEIHFIETKDGFMIKPVSNPISRARGVLKNRKFSTKRYFQLKAEEKEIERE